MLVVWGTVGRPGIKDSSEVGALMVLNLCIILLSSLCLSRARFTTMQFAHCDVF